MGGSGKYFSSRIMVTVSSQTKISHVATASTWNIIRIEIFTSLCTTGFNLIITNQRFYYSEPTNLLHLKNFAALVPIFQKKNSKNNSMIQQKTKMHMRTAHAIYRFIATCLRGATYQFIKKVVLFGFAVFVVH